MGRDFVLVLVIVSIFLISGCTNQTVTSSEPTALVENEVSIINFAFEPAELTVAEETTVTWKHRDSVVHTVTSSDGLFESGNLNRGDEFNFTFTEAGEYNYFCSIHPRMEGKVVVENV